MDGMNELAIAYILQGVLKALDYIHHMGYVHRCVPSHLTLTSHAGVHNQGSGLRAHLGGTVISLSVLKSYDLYCVRGSSAVDSPALLLCASEQAYGQGKTSLLSSLCQEN